MPTQSVSWKLLGRTRRTYPMWRARSPRVVGDAAADTTLPLSGCSDRHATSTQLIDTIGNLPLLTGRLNSKVSNGPWPGPEGKRAALDGHDVLLLNRQLLAHAATAWDEDQIRNRTERLIDAIIQVWVVPQGHKSQVQPLERRPERRVELSDVMAAGLLAEGTTLYARRRRLAHLTATVLPDGSLDVAGDRYSSPSGASRAVSGTNENGWYFWLLDPKSKRSLHDLWQEYVDQRDLDPADDDPAGDDAADEEDDRD